MCPTLKTQTPSSKTARSLGRPNYPETILERGSLSPPAAPSRSVLWVRQMLSSSCVLSHSILSILQTVLRVPFHQGQGSLINQLCFKVTELRSGDQSEGGQGRGRGPSYLLDFLWSRVSSVTGSMTGRGLGVARGRRAGEMTPCCGLEYLTRAYFFTIWFLDAECNP